VVGDCAGGAAGGAGVELLVGGVVADVGVDEGLGERTKGAALAPLLVGAVKYVSYQKATFAIILSILDTDKIGRNKVHCREGGG
jgi:hypothetical protein